MFFEILLFCFYSCANTFDLNTFKGAVYEHHVIMPENTEAWVNRSFALENMMKNIYVYQKQAIKAGKEGVDILVFPEDGIYGNIFNRKSVESYLEYIPNPELEKWNACDEPDRYNNTEIQHSLSCMAKHNNLYIVADMGDYQPCSRQSDPKCPPDGHYQFNTAVVYDKAGYLIAKYHKINLFYEFQFDVPPERKSVSFETPFGKFGVMICFDIIFRNPAIDLLENHDVDSIVFPTAWMDALPLLAAIQFHSAFAAGANINFLASNIKKSESKFHGSGIYSPTGYLDFYYSEDNVGKLLIADIPIYNRKRNSYPELNMLTEENNSRPSNDSFQSFVFHDLYNFVPLIDIKDKRTICHNKLCCSLTYEKVTNTDDVFAFGAFDGLHTFEGTYYIQVCILLKCKNSNLTSCGEPDKNSITFFKQFKIEGTFNTSYIFPEILLSNASDLLLLAAPNTWKYATGILQSEIQLEYPVVSAAMLARVYEKDHILISDKNPNKITEFDFPTDQRNLLLHVRIVITFYKFLSAVSNYIISLLQM
ncbi:pantetheinase-like [Mytilus edulis]|uniref:pantetheinase-like n=1 Tax=Mytilus edulis TaxID=6550 RepID=UPI0039EFC96A